MHTSRRLIASSLFLVAVTTAQAGSGAELRGFTSFSPPDSGAILDRSADHDGCEKRLAVIGLTSTQQLVPFSSDKIGKTRSVVSIVGLAGDTAIVGIDYRPATGELYGLGNAGGVYTLDPETGVATFESQLTVLPSGASFGVDFNPTVDRLRIVSDTGQNLRANVDTGATTVDLALTAMGIADAAYTNNDADPNTATTLFDIDAALDQVVIQAPPNNGNINPAGKLLVDAGSAVGFDIYTNTRSAANQAFASLQVDGVSGFYRIDVLSGRATLVGEFRGGTMVTDIAIAPAQCDDEDDD